MSNIFGLDRTLHETIMIMFTWGIYKGWPGPDIAVFSIMVMIMAICNITKEDFTDELDILIVLMQH